MPYIYPWNPDSPIGEDPANQLHTYIQVKAKGVQERIETALGLDPGDFAIMDPVQPKDLVIQNSIVVPEIETAYLEVISGNDIPAGLIIANLEGENAVIELKTAASTYSLSVKGNDDPDPEHFDFYKDTTQLYNVDESGNQRFLTPVTFDNALTLPNPLEVIGNASTKVKISAENTGTGTAQLELKTTTSNYRIEATNSSDSAANSLRILNTSGSTLLRLQENGNLTTAGDETRTGSLNLSANLTVGGTLNVNTIDPAVNLSIAGGIAVTGIITGTSSLTVSGSISGLSLTAEQATLVRTNDVSLTLWSNTINGKDYKFESRTSGVFALRDATDSVDVFNTFGSSIQFADNVIAPGIVIADWVLEDDTEVLKLNNTDSGLTVAAFNKLGICQLRTLAVTENYNQTLGRFYTGEEVHAEMNNLSIGRPFFYGLYDGVTPPGLPVITNINGAWTVGTVVGADSAGYVEVTNSLNPNYATFRLTFDVPYPMTTGREPIVFASIGSATLSSILMNVYLEDDGTNYTSCLLEHSEGAFEDETYKIQWMIV